MSSTDTVSVVSCSSFKAAVNSCAPWAQHVRAAEGRRTRPTEVSTRNPSKAGVSPTVLTTHLCAHLSLQILPVSLLVSHHSRKNLKLLSSTKLYLTKLTNHVSVAGNLQLKVKTKFLLSAYFSPTHLSLLSCQLTLELAASCRRQSLISAVSIQNKVTLFLDTITKHYI